jgi:hypothetical protein
MSRGFMPAFCTIILQTPIPSRDWRNSRTLYFHFDPKNSDFWTSSALGSAAGPGSAGLRPADAATQVLAGARCLRANWSPAFCGDELLPLYFRKDLKDAYALTPPDLASCPLPQRSAPRLTADSTSTATAGSQGTATPASRAARTRHTTPYISARPSARRFR